MEKTTGDKAGGGSSFWEKNLRLIRRRYPGLAEQLRAGTEGPAPEGDEKGWNGNEADMKVETTAAGLPSLAVKGRYIHSHRDPAREARRLAETLEGEDPPGPLLALGFGLGYGVEGAADRFPGRPLIIVERHPPVLRKALECRDLTAFLGSQHIIFVLGGTGEGVKAALGLFEDTPWKGRPLVVKNQALLSLNEDWYGDLERRIGVWISRQDVNQATLRRFGKRWVRNLSRNMAAIRDLPGISPLEGVLACRKDGPEIPVFLAAAGPSLDRAGPLLQAIHRRCLVVAVDTSLRFLLNRGVDPDFTLVVDPQYWNSRHLDRAPAPHTRLIAESAVYPPVLRRPWKALFLCGSLFPLGRFIEDRVDPKGRLGAGGSVATTAWDFARLLGTRQIWIAGLDLAYPDLKTHFRGALFEDRSHTESNRRAPAETWSVRALRDGQPFRAPSGIPGDAAGVLTDRRLSLYAAWFEHRFRRFPEIRNYRLSPGGLAVKGLEEASPQALLALPDRREEIDRRLNQVFDGIQAEFYKAEAICRRADQYERARRALLEGLERVKAAAEQGARAAEQALGGPPPDQEKVLAALDKTLKIITESEVKEVAGFLFPPPDEGEKNPRAGEDSFRSYLMSSVKLYRALAEAADYNLRELTHSGRNSQRSEG